MTEEEFAFELARQLNDDRAGDDSLGSIVADGVHVHVYLAITKEEFTLLVIKEDPQLDRGGDRAQP